MSDRPRAGGFCYWASEACCKLAYHSGESRPSDKGEGGSHPDPEIRGEGGDGLQNRSLNPPLYQKNCCSSKVFLGLVKMTRASTC